ncbi:MAG: glycosyltransferase family 4 protein [Blastocatellia bacterium]
MKIVYLNPSGQLGGAEISLLEILASLRAVRPNWHLHLLVAEDGPLALKAQALGVSTMIIPFPPALARLGDANRFNRFFLLYKMLSAVKDVLVYVKRLRAALRLIAPDVLHTNGFKMHILGLWSRPPRVPVIWHIHDYVSKRPVMARLLRRYARQCAAAVVNSESVARDLRSVCGNISEIHTVYNGVDLNRFSPSGETVNLDSLAGLPPAAPETVRVGLIATFGRWKGQPVFLKALSLLPARLPVRGYVIGSALYQTDGSQYSLTELRNLASQLGIAEKTGFTGFIENSEAAIRSLDIVVHASTEPEPFGLVIAEAMACGRAVIVSESGGAAEITDTGINALGHSPGDAYSLAIDIERLSTNLDLRIRLGNAGRATAELRFDRLRLASDLIPIYKQAISSTH